MTLRLCFSHGRIDLAASPDRVQFLCSGHFMVQVDILGFGFDLPRAHVLYGLVGLFLAMLVAALWLRQGRNETLAAAIGPAGALGLLGGLPIFPEALSTFVLICVVVLALLAIAYEMKKHRRNVLAAAAYVLLWLSVAYFSMFGLFWLATNPWLLQG